MDAWLLGFFGLSSPSAKPVLTASNAAKRSADTVEEQQAPASTPVLHHRQPQPRIAHWDKKREKCQNCSHIYLKTLSRHPGFCSVDCKSNSAYIAKVNRTIRAVKDAVERQQQDEQAESAAVATEQDKRLSNEDGDDCEDDIEADCDVPQPHTFADFGLESRIHDAPNVQWAFSAVY
jgi:hypothetical protein